MKLEKARLIILYAILAILVVTLGILIYNYIGIITPPRPKGRPVEAEGVTHILSIYGYGSKPEEQFNRPHDVAVDKKGNIYVADTLGGRIMVFGEKGKLLFKFGNKSYGVGEIRKPSGVAVAPNGNIYVADRGASKILIFNSKGKFIKEWLEMMPLIPRIANDKLYVTTYGHVAIYSLDGDLLEKWGKRGRAPGEFDFPNGIAITKDGNTYVSDGNNIRLQAFNSKGDVLWVVGERPETTEVPTPSRRFDLPAGLALGEKGYLYMADAWDNSIRIFTQKGKELTKVGEQGTAEDQFDFPAGIVHKGGNVFVITDEQNNRVQVVEIAIPGE